MKYKVKSISKQLGFKEKVQDYGLLVKHRLTLTVVFSAVMAYAIASPAISWWGMLLLGIGGFFVTAAANAMNQVIEKEYDLLMVRTANRPVAAGRMSVSEAVLLVGIMSVIGIFSLAMFNPLSAFLGSVSFMLYAFVYTPLKRVSPASVLIGAVPGALPMMIGVVAVEGSITPMALMLFGIQFFWQMPHFWAIGWLGYKDYKKAGFKMTPDTGDNPDNSLGWQAALFALMLLPLAWVGFAWGLTGLWASGLLSLAALAYAWYGFVLYRQNTREAARRLMFSSFAYLPFVLIVLLIDKF
ncbi:MAG: protoheme IX farnesyltransferase [Eudoraea sp.]|nr:protoheme IX farnesyltransferase [Eudoraea sp.]NNE28047.1 protoheme IX farnesyltransferase [Saprospiraceae bacterium]